MKKRGQVDFRLPLVVFTGAAAFAITAIVVLLAIGTINNAQVFGGAPTVSHSVTNESDDSGAIVLLNNTGYTLSRVNGTNSGYAITAVWVNLTGTGNTPELAPAANYTVSAAGVLTNNTVVGNQTKYNNVSVSYTYTETYPAQLGQLATGNLTGNVSAGVNTISAKLPTVFLVIAIILVLSAIAILVVVWRNFRGGGAGSFG